MDDPRAAAARARDGRRAGRRAGAGAVLAGARRAHAHAERDSAHRVREVDLDLCTDVRAARRTWPGAPPLPEERLAEERCEDVREAAEVRIHRRKPTAAQAGVAEPVVGLPALGIRQHLVRLGNGTESELGVGLLADIGMELAREPPESRLDLRRGSRRGPRRAARSSPAPQSPSARPVDVLCEPGELEGRGAHRADRLLVVHPQRTEQADSAERAVR